MLDENLPNFFLKASTDGVKHHQSFYFSQHGNDPQPHYDLHHLDPNSPDARNTYASALFDCHNPDVLFGEVLLKPGWTHPTVSQEEIRKNGGVAPPPQPILPTSFPIQLYEPDQHIEVVQKSSSWSNSNWYEFSLPQQTFRAPSASALDRSRNDPAADATIPKLNFVWRRESKLSKDMTCFLTGKSTDPTNKKKKHKEPDIAVALFSGLKDLTVYESNLYRVDIEDYKGLEIVLLLSATVIKDVFFGNIKDAFHIDDYGRKNSAGRIPRKNSSPRTPSGGFIAATGPAPAIFTQSPQQLQPSPYAIPPQRPAQPSQRPQQPSSRNDHKRQSLPPLQTPKPHSQPATTPLTQYQIDQETARLRAESDAQHRASEARQRERQKAAEAETKRLRKQMEAEEKEKRRRQAEVDKETERLRRKYGTQGQIIPMQPPRPNYQRPPHPQPQPVPVVHRPHPQQQPPRQHHRPPANANGLYPVPQGRVPQHHQQQPPPQPTGWHVQRPVVAPNMYFGGGGQIKPDSGQTLKNPKRSFFGLKRESDSAGKAKVTKKKSSMF